jgi:methionyl-tRNA synthetase
VEWVEEASYFFKLSAYQEKLLELYKRPDFVLPKERLNEVASFVRGGLQDLSISRTTFDWGIRVPGADGHIMYVWVDALTNYITGVGFPDTGSEKFKRYWPAALHVIGKDIVRFHAVYWPAFLMSAGIAVPQRIFSHGFLFNRGEKMSKSVGNVIDPFTMADTYGVDQFRYFFLREVPFGQDGNYSHEAIVNRINADLANDLGNLAQRSLSMITKASAGKLAEPGAFSESDKTILASADAMIGTAREHMKTQQLHHVLNCIWAVVADANRYFASEAPWALAKTDPKRQGTVLYVTAEILRQVAILAQPFVPTSASKLLDLLAISPDDRSFDALGPTKRIKAGATLPAPVPVFPRFVDAESKGCRVVSKRKRARRGPRALLGCHRLTLLHTDCFDLLFGVGLRLEGRWPDLDPGGFGRTSFDDLALLCRLLLNDVIVGTGRGRDERQGGSGESQFLQHCFLSSGTSTTNKSSGH